MSPYLMQGTDAEYSKRIQEGELAKNKGLSILDQLQQKGTQSTLNTRAPISVGAT